MCSLAVHYRTVLQNEKDKTSKTSLKEQSIIKYSLGLLQDTKHLRIRSGNRAKILLKSYLGIDCHSQYIKVVRLIQLSSANSYNDSEYGCIVRGLETFIMLVYSHLITFPILRTALINLAKVTVNGLCNCGAQNPAVTEAGAQNTSLWHTTHNGNKFTSTTIHQNVLWSI